MTEFKGTGVAMVTPFKENGEVDLRRLETHTNHLIEGGVDYLVVLGTTAETPTLSSTEKQEILDGVAEAAQGKVPLMAGMGGNDTKNLIRSLGSYRLDAYQGILSVSPYYNKPTQEGIYQHFTALASSSKLPILLYNVPGRTGSNMEADTSLRLARDFPGRIFGIKEASGDLDQAKRIALERPDNFLLLSGDDASAMDMILLGGEGLISVAANALPEKISALVQHSLKGELDEAKKLNASLAAFIETLFREGNPAGIKAAIKARGWGEQVLRLPLLPASKILSDSISAMVKELLD